MPREAVFSIEDGVITALAGGPLSLADVGERSTARVSHVEFNTATGVYDVTDAVSNELLHSEADYDVALAWEVAHYNERIKNS